ncbi:MAG: hypothetical protein P8016_01245 [Sedimentisphaerales bacterium]
MNKNTFKSDKLEKITRKWWFFLLFILLQFLVPPYASKGYEWNQWGDVISFSLRNAYVNSHSQLYPFFKIVPVVLILLIIIFRNRFRRVFSIYVAFSYVVFALGQNIAITEKYGLSICTVNVLMFLAVASFWIWEAIVLKNDFRFLRIPMWRYWVIPPALLAFWAPSNLHNIGLADLFNNGAGMAFCMMTPVYVGLLTLYHPRVNTAALRVTSLVGIIIGFYNMIVNFVINPATSWWNGILHLPLLLISIYGLFLSFKNHSQQDLVQL